MNKAKGARWCDPLEGVQRTGDSVSGYYNFWGGRGGWRAHSTRRGGGLLVYIYLYICRFNLKTEHIKWLLRMPDPLI